MTDEGKLVAMATAAKLNAISQNVGAVLMLCSTIISPDKEQRREALSCAKDLAEKAQESAAEAHRLADMVNEIWGSEE